MSIRDEKRIREIINSKTILTPSQQFKTLGLNDDDFISFSELCEISRQETLEKLYALRELCNVDKPEYDIIKGIAYSEKIRPVLTLLFSRDATSRYVTETFDIPYHEDVEEVETQDEEKEKDSKKKKRRKEEETVPAYSIDPDTLTRLLEMKKSSSQIDEYLIKNQRELLELYKEFLDTQVFYPDFYTCDSTGNVEISSTHENYIAIGKNDSIIIPDGFGEINMHYLDGLITSFNRTYNPRTEEVTNSSKEIVSSYLSERIFIHKALLPQNYSRTQKQGV